MSKTTTVLAVAAAILVAVTVRACVTGSAWQARATAAEHSAASLQSSVDSLENVAKAAEAAAAHKDTVRRSLTKQVAQTDSATHPDTTCTKSLTARDDVIANDAGEIQDLITQAHNQMLALATLQASNDTLKAALAARPRASVTVALLHPALHLSLQAMVYPRYQVGVGVSYDLVTWTP